jgi:hypothetical protein
VFGVAPDREAAEDIAERLAGSKWKVACASSLA